jgi:hypothetical protein
MEFIRGPNARRPFAARCTVQCQCGHKDRDRALSRRFGRTCCRPPAPRHQGAERDDGGRWASCAHGFRRRRRIWPRSPDRPRGHTALSRTRAPVRRKRLGPKRHLQHRCAALPRSDGIVSGRRDGESRVGRFAKRKSASTIFEFPRKFLTVFYFPHRASWLALTLDMLFWRVTGTIVGTVPSSRCSSSDTFLTPRLERLRQTTARSEDLPLGTVRVVRPLGRCLPEAGHAEFRPARPGKSGSQ